MSQTIDPINVVSLAKALDSTHKWDPEETMPVPIEALMNSLDAPALTEQERQEPHPAADDRDRMLTAYLVAGRILREAPLPIRITVAGPVTPDESPRIEVMLDHDRDRSQMAGYRKLFGGEITHKPYTGLGISETHSELRTWVDAIDVRVWTLCAITEVAA